MNAGVRRRLDRRPGWNPEWTDAGHLVEDLQAMWPPPSSTATRRAVFSRTAARRPLNLSSSTMARIIYDRLRAFAAGWALFEGTRASRLSCTVARPTSGCPGVSHGGTAPTKGGPWDLADTGQGSGSRLDFRAGHFRGRVCPSETSFSARRRLATTVAQVVLSRVAPDSRHRCGPLAARDDAESGQLTSRYRKCTNTLHCTTPCGRGSSARVPTVSRRSRSTRCSTSPPTAEVDGVKFDGIDLFLFDPHIEHRLRATTT